MRLLLPPITDNDIKYRSAIRSIKDTADLRSDRYRLAVARVGDVHWFATDVAVIEQRLMRSPVAQQLDSTELFRIGQGTWRSRDRFQMFVNVDRVLELGTLSPEVAVDKGLLKWARELQLHPAVSVAVSSEPGPSRVRLRIRLDRRQ